MTVLQLECFLAAARTRHFRQAAERLGKTQPALSVHIQRLEAELGLTLFERTGRHVSLTGAAEILLPLAEKTMAAVEEARVKMEEVRGGARGVVRVGVLPTIAAHFLPPALKLFRSRFADVAVLLREGARTAHLLPLLLDNEIDLSIALQPPRSAGFKSVPLLTEDLCLAVSLQHRLAGRAKVSVASVKDEPFILYKTPGHSTRELTLKACRTAGFEPKVAFESEEAETIQYLVAADLGVTVLPEMVLRHGGDKGLAMVRLQAPTPRRTVVATWQPGRYLSPLTRQFLACAEQIGRTWPVADQH